MTSREELPDLPLKTAFQGLSDAIESQKGHSARAVQKTLESEAVANYCRIFVLRVKNDRAELLRRGREFLDANPHGQHMVSDILNNTVYVEWMPLPSDADEVEETIIQTVGREIDPFLQEIEEELLSERSEQ